MKKISVFIISILFSIPVFSGVTGLAKDMDSNSALEIVDTLSVIDTEVDSADAVVTRKLAALYVARMLNIDNKMSDVRYFVDVENEQFATYAINNLVERGIIAVPDNKQFRPDANVTYEEMLKMLVCALGYDQYAELNGGWAEGYYQVASMLDISYKPSDRRRLTVEDVAQLILEALKAPVYESNVSGGSITYEPGESLLEKTKKIKVKRGTVEAAAGMSITDAYSDTESDKIVISGEIYDMNQEFNPSAYIGSYVEYYVKGEDYEEEVIFIVSGIKGEAEVKINIKDFSSYDKNTLFYYKDGSDRLAKIEVENPRIVYNGEFLDENINQTMKSLNKGWIYIKDSDANSSYDTVIVENFDSRIVSSVDKTNEVVYVKEGADKVIKVNTFKNIVAYDEIGSKIDLFLLQPGTVISVMESNNKNYIRIITSTKELNGTVTAISDSYYGKKCFIVDDVDYRIDNSHRMELESQVNVGGVYTFKLDAFEEIAMCSLYENSDYKIGYLLDLKINEDLEDGIFLKIFTENGITQRLQLANFMTIDNVRCSNADKVHKRVCEAFGVGEETDVIPQLIGYKVNDEEKIVFIDTANPRDGESEEGSLTKAYETDNVKRYYSISGNASTVRNYGRQALINNNTKVFYIPYGQIDEELCFVGTRSTLLIEERAYYGNVYKLSSLNPYGDVMVCLYTNDNIHQNSDARRNIVMFDKARIEYDQERDEVRKMIDVYYGSQLQTLSAPEDLNLDGISRGDVISFSYDIHGNIQKGSSVIKYVDVEDIDAPLNQWNLIDGARLYNEGRYQQNLQLSFGKVSKNNNNVITLFTDDVKAVVDIADVTNAGIAIYNKTEDVITTNASEILDYEVAGEDCTRIVMHTRNGRYMNAYGYKK